MNKVKMQVELEYDPETMHGKNQAAVNWFFNDILKGNDLQLIDSWLGDIIGNIKVLQIEEVTVEDKTPPEQ